MISVLPASSVAWRGDTTGEGVAGRRERIASVTSPPHLWPPTYPHLEVALKNAAQGGSLPHPHFDAALKKVACSHPHLEAALKEVAQERCALGRRCRPTLHRRSGKDWERSRAQRLISCRSIQTYARQCISHFTGKPPLHTRPRAPRTRPSLPRWAAQTKILCDPCARGTKRLCRQSRSADSREVLHRETTECPTASKTHMKVRPALGDGHKAVELHARVLPAGMPPPRPHGVDPVNLPYNTGRAHEWLQRRARELQRNDVEDGATEGVAVEVLGPVVEGPAVDLVLRRYRRSMRHSKGVQCGLAGGYCRTNSPTSIMSIGYSWPMRSATSRTVKVGLGGTMCI